MNRNMTTAKLNEDLDVNDVEVEPMMVHYPLYTPEGVSVELSEKVQSDIVKILRPTLRVTAQRAG